MKRINTNKFVTAKRKNESVEDPHELLLSLVDMGSLDADEALLACVQEMSDAECKRVLSSLSLPSSCDGCDKVEFDTTPDNAGEDESADDDLVLDYEDEDDDAEDDSEDVEECDNRASELEARIRRLEKNLRSESMSRNRINRFSHRKMNR
jgi:hypothetical protein